VTGNNKLQVQIYSHYKNTLLLHIPGAGG